MVDKKMCFKLAPYKCEPGETPPSHYPLYMALLIGSGERGRGGIKYFRFDKGSLWYYLLKVLDLK